MGLLSASHLALRAVRCSLGLAPKPKSWLSTAAGYLGEKNILLMGPPGAGKTTVGRIVACRLGLPAFDVDDDVLETTWKMPVASKLAAVGGERFLQEEGQALCNFSASGCVVSLTGSNPLHPEAMQHVKGSGVVIYLDVDSEEILQRLHIMKVDRIVGQEAGLSIGDILSYRKQFYEKWLDMRVLCGRGDTAEEVAEKVLQAVERYHNTASETYVSTRSDGERSSSETTHFSDVVVEGLASDGGLYVPKNGFPKMGAREWLRLVDMTYQEQALVLLEKCIHPLDVSALDLREMIYKAYASNFSSEEVAPVKHLIHNTYIQELFHGPTASFKDLALQLMPQLFAHCLPPMCNYLILVATSGDTGSAVLSGFGGLRGAERRRTGVLVFFPEEGVSEIQKLQMTSSNQSNAKAVSVRCDFDFCQRSIKRMFGESGLTGHLAVEYATVLSTANSINWARLLPQVVYHSTAYLNLCRDGVICFGEPVDVCIPTGNFGNAMSAVYAREMGIPIRKVLCASNHNRVVSDFINTGDYDLRDRRLTPSHSPAIDILKSSNLERFIYHVSNGDGRLVKDLFTRLDRQQHFRLPGPLLGRIQQEVQAGWCSEADCLAAIQSVHAQAGYIMDTHTAVAKVVADRLQDATCPVVICSTAHYGKFAPAVFKALQMENMPQGPLEQLEMLRRTAAIPVTHRDIMACVRGGYRQGHPVCEADYSALVEEVENMIQDSFLKVM
ncbi:threonine synthase-like 1 [Nerophis ophidion]|uniref:threonine synthase-like 1 n=1 Tax=Nerophis ophidion TaxID=159077 RepID=UPI002AE002C1|nr:threonine synthase-like 1 [Nerophis ophidion]XP_061777562.1 threonine synthase-like 1 [Nerophis ophidion]XP_061777563.1 threonine synthase-like 1 [Nerophis ophidion]XP_061777564.1 threonine synthase-like 1 [Nerophis ophidion]XP_061777565.1 threonine synthase-like 1 [Nerophis ophidion]